MIESILFSKTIDTESANKIIEKIENNLTTKFYKKGAKNICRVKEPVLADREILRKNLLTIQRAIDGGVQISFTFNGYDKYKKLVPNHNKKDTVSPYYIVASGGRYYLLACKELVFSEKIFRNMSIWRIDLMSEIEIPGRDEKHNINGIPSVSKWKVDNLPQSWSEDFQLSHLNMSFDNPVKIAHHREYLTYTGTLEGVPVTVTSTGIGGPSAGIAIEELYSCGAHTMMRIGSAASTSPKVKLGDVVIPNGAVRMEGTGNHYLPFEFPAVPDYEMLRALEEAAEKLGYPYNIGVTITKDSYYTEAEPETKPVYHELKEKWDSYLKGGATNTSMECSILFLIGASLGIRTSSVMISATNFGEYSNDADDYPSGWEERAIEVGIEAMKIMIRKDRQAAASV